MRVRLLHPNASANSGTWDTLRDAGFKVEYNIPFDTSVLRACRKNPPDVFVIDLSRLPSHGREIATALRQSVKTRHVPIIFCGGVTEKVEAIRAKLSDAVYCTQAELVKAVVAARRLENPIKPTDAMNRYGSRTTAQKLCIEADGTVALINPPRDVERVLGELPGGTELVEDQAAVTLCFAHSGNDLRAGLASLRALAATSKCWLLWRKKSAVGHAGVTEPLVRETGIALGLVDYKICSVDATWSAMLFAKKKVP